MKTLTLFIMALFAVQAPAPPGQSATVEGNVTLFGTAETIPKVQITLRSIGGGTPQSSAVTDARGHFIFTDLPAGIYDMSAQRGGYANPARNGMRIEGSSQMTLTVASQQHLENADLTLVRGGVITGRVIDAIGKPIPQLQVEARSTGADGKSIADFPSKSAQTNDRGEYRLFDLDPGQYIVSAEFRELGAAASLEPQGSWVKTFFPGVGVTAKAIALDVGVGAVMTAPDFAIQSVAKFTISGVVTAPRPDITGLSLQGVYLVPNDADESSRERLIPTRMTNLVPGVAVAGNMRFEIRAVPGSYELFVQLQTAGARTSFAGRTVIQVTQQDVKDIVIATTAVTLNGQVLVTGRAPGPASVRVLLVPRDFPAILGIGVNRVPTVVDSTGRFTIADIPKGRWTISLSNIPGDLAIADIRQGNTSISRDEVRVGDKDAEPIQLVLSPAGSIEGFVRDADQKPIAAMRVAEYPYNLPAAAEAHQSTTDTAGHFVLSGLAPGEHSLFAIDPTLLTGPFSDAYSIKPALAPYQSQAALAKVTSGASTSVTLTPLKFAAPTQP